MTDGVRPRYAIYFAPATGSALERFGRRWLGRDAATGEIVAQPDLPNIAAITAEARRYGFHATLKPPFALAEGTDAAMLEAAIADFVATRNKIVAPSLTLAAIDGFLALVPSAAAPDLHRLAEHCVARFDPFRAPASPAELAKRRAGGLTAAQEALLSRWGYPHVFECFRFHMTLTRHLSSAERAAIEPAIGPLLAEACAGPLLIDALSLFVQPDRTAAFRLVRRFALA